MQKAKTTIKFVLAFLFESLIVCIYLLRSPDGAHCNCSKRSRIMLAFSLKLTTLIRSFSTT